MGIQINGQTDTISATDGSLTVSGADLTNPININVSGVSTFGNTVVGGGTTQLIVTGNARITGILTIGTSSITLDGSNNQVNVGTGVTLHHTNGVQVGDNNLHSTVLTVNQINASGVVTATTFSGSLTGNATGLSGTPNITVGNITASSATINGNVSVAGTLTYEDVTNVDSIGIVTARTGVRIDAGGLVVVGVTTVAAGSTVAPSISPTGDSNTGIFFPAADTIAFGEGGSEALRINSSGNVGIQESSPDLPLHVSGSNAYPASSGSVPTGFIAVRAKTVGATHGLHIGVANASPWGSWLQSQDKNNLATNYPLLLNPNGGNVGIGTNNPSEKLHVEQTANRYFQYTSGGNIEVYGPESGNNGNYVRLGASYNQLGLYASNTMYFNTSNTGGFVFGQESSEKVRIDSSGRVRMPYQPVFYAYQTAGAATNATGIFSSTQWNATLVNTGSHFSTSNGRFTAPVAGVYMFQIKGLARHVGSNGSVEISLYKNGANVVSRSFGYSYMVASNDHATITAIAYLSLAVNDYVQMGIHALAAGTDLYYGENLGSFCGHLIG